MKRFYGIVIFLLLAAVLLSGCRPANMEGTGHSSTPPVTTTRHMQPTQPPVPSTADPAIKLIWGEMKEAYAGERHSDIKLKTYGIYGEKYVAICRCSCCATSGASWEEQLGAFLFRHSSGNGLDVYHAGLKQILGLQAAYEAGWFTDDELASLHEKYMSRDYTEE